MAEHEAYCTVDYVLRRLNGENWEVKINFAVIIIINFIFFVFIDPMAAIYAVLQCMQCNTVYTYTYTRTVTGASYDATTSIKS